MMFQRIVPCIHIISMIGCMFLETLLAYGQQNEFHLTPSLDQIYRNNVRNENNGELPYYIINQKFDTLPSFTGKLSSELGVSIMEIQPPDKKYKIIYTLDNNDISIPSWQESIEAVAQNNPSPFHISIINERAKTHDPQAIELVAWILANGIGVKKNNISAFIMYSKAHQLGVETAKNNALLVYKKMSSQERQQISRLF